MSRHWSQGGFQADLERIADARTFPIGWTTREFGESVSNDRCRRDIREVVQVAAQHAAQRLVIEHHNVIQAFPADGSDDALHIRDLSG